MSTAVATPPAPAVEAPRPGDPDARRRLLLVVLAGLTVLLGALVPLAPVVGEQPVVTWPAAGAPAEPTGLPLAAHRPLEITATVPCAALRDDGVTALSTGPPGAGYPADARLVVGAGSGATAGVVTVRSSGQGLVADPRPAGDCTYEVVADRAGTRVLRDGVLLADRPGLLPPTVAELTTDTPGVDGLAARVLPDDRYASSPSALKTALLVAHLLALAATLVLALRWLGGDGPRRDRLRPHPADAAAVAVSVGWAFVGPGSWDDAWYLLMARGADESGYLGNAVYMFNSTENPFVLSQYALQAWGSLGGWSLLWLRALPVAYGLLTYLLLRALLAGALGRAARLRAVPWLLLVAHLLWWLPYGMQLRPEPVIALCGAAVLAAAEAARRRRSPGLLALAVAAVALAFTASPSGIVAAAPLLVGVPWIVRLLRERGWLASTAVCAAAATAAVPVGFADASLGEVLDTTATHTWYYVTHAWYEESLHYNGLLLLADTGVWGRRAPVLLTLAVLALAAVGSGRRAGSDPVRRLLLSSALAVAVGLALLALTPTKWVNHFGAVAAAGTVLLTAALLRSPLPAGRPRSSVRRPATGPVAAAGAVAVVVLAASLTFAGPNVWRPYWDWGQPFGDRTLGAWSLAQAEAMAPAVGPVALRNPLVWLAVAGAVLLAARRWRRPSLTPDRGLLVVVSTTAVLLLLAVFAAGPLTRYPGWSVGLSSARTLTGEPCGLAPDVDVLVPTGAQPVASGAATVDGDFALAAESRPPLLLPSDGARVWHDAVPPGPDARERGTLATPWFPVPAGTAATHLSVPVAAGVWPGQRVAVETGTADGAVTGVVELPVDGGADGRTWQEVPLALDALPGGRPAAVRVVAEDRVTAAGSWVAVAEPRLTAAAPISSVTGGQPAYADQVWAQLWPCVDQIAIEHGIAGSASVLLRAGDGVPPFIFGNFASTDWGGALLQADRTATYVQLAGQLRPGGPPTRPWGSVLRIVQPHPSDGYDLEVVRSDEAGWHRDRPVTGVEYAGRAYVG